MGSSRGLVDRPEITGEDEEDRIVEGDEGHVERVVGLPKYRTLRAPRTAAGEGAGDGVLRTRTKPFMYSIRSSDDGEGERLPRARPLSSPATLRAGLRDRPRRCPPPHDAERTWDR